MKSEFVENPYICSGRASYSSYAKSFSGKVHLDHASRPLRTSSVRSATQKNMKQPETIQSLDLGDY